MMEICFQILGRNMKKYKEQEDQEWRFVGAGGTGVVDKDVSHFFFPYEVNNLLIKIQV